MISARRVAYLARCSSLHAVKSYKLCQNSTSFVRTASFSSIKDGAKSSIPSNSANNEPEEIEIYNKPQELSIKAMFGVSCVSMVYWSSHIFNYYYFYGQVVEGIPLQGDPMYGLMGCVVSTGLMYFTRYFAHASVYRSYLTSDSKRIGFQVHTVIGDMGKKYEVSIGNAKFVSRKQEQEIVQLLANKAAKEQPTSSQQAAVKQDAVGKKDGKKKSFLEEVSASVFQSSLVPIKLKNLPSNLLLDKEQLLSGTEKTQQLVEILHKAEELLVVPKVARNKAVGQSSYHSQPQQMQMQHQQMQQNQFTVKRKQNKK